MRYPPLIIREASKNIETNSLLAKIFLEDVEFYDVGDLDLIGLEKIDSYIKNKGIKCPECNGVFEKPYKFNL